ncbi:MAG: hypothetical protein IPJ95_09790 [Gemmatimonadetes bacterium]|nr:hypothetical protein [Gemmatimonadota bacterium]MBP9198421.1 hypothetical protein [Gemmatimonadales bacterium]MBK6779357.1 hypothetical protein [Gemmatimonadota bacterium]MBK7348330.1 hypothetical protein [Gemmatimonadota bacterium]MBK7782955.1 hypothetical protein [Gemmatimonadota bacterium]
MHRWIRFKLEVGWRVSGFCEQHPAACAAAPRQLERLAACLAEAERCAHELLHWRRAGLAATGARNRSRRDLQAHELRVVIDLLRAAARRAPGHVTPYPMPPFRANEQDFRSACTLAANEADRAAAFVRLVGLLPDDVARLRAGLAEWERLGRQARTAVQRRVEATAGLAARAAELLDIIHLLDAVMRSAFRRDPAARAAWHNARHIPWPARRRRADPEPPITAAPGR